AGIAPGSTTARTTRLQAARKPPRSAGTSTTRAPTAAHPSGGAIGAVRARRSMLASATERPPRAAPIVGGLIEASCADPAGAASSAGVAAPVSRTHHRPTADETSQTPRDQIPWSPSLSYRASYRKALAAP